MPVVIKVIDVYKLCRNQNPVNKSSTDKNEQKESNPFADKFYAAAPETLLNFLKFIFI